MDKLKKLFSKPAFVVCIFLIPLLVVLLILGEGNFEDYYDGIFTEVIGIIITVIFVQWIFDKKNMKDMADKEKNKNEQEKKQELERIEKFNRILQKYIQEYTFYFNCVTTPIGKRDDTKDDLNESFGFSDMYDLHKSGLSLRKNINQSAIYYFYEYEQKIMQYIIAVLTQSQFKYYKEIDKLFLEFINVSANGDFKDFILANEANKGTVDFITNVMKHKSGKYIEGFERKDVKYTSNIAYPYYILYNLLIAEKRIITNYQKLIESIIEQ